MGRRLIMAFALAAMLAGCAGYDVIYLDDGTRCVLVERVYGAAVDCEWKRQGGEGGK